MRTPNEKWKMGTAGWQGAPTGGWSFLLPRGPGVYRVLARTGIDINNGMGRSGRVTCSRA
ncbi:MAG: hypothetical protein ACKVS6_15480 [Planctomycetota bacterium]